MDERFAEVDRRLNAVDQHLAVIDQRFEELGRRFEDADKRFGRIESELRTQGAEMKAGFEGMHRMLVHFAIAMVLALVGLYGGLVGLFATQL